jgi:hypothetical protein
MAMLYDFERDPGQQMFQVFYAHQYASWVQMLNQYQLLAYPAIRADVDGRFSMAAMHPTEPLITFSWEPRGRLDRQGP